MSTLSSELKQGDVAYMMAGVGMEEAAAMRQDESRFPRTLEFLKQAKPHAEYGSGFSVIIKNHEGKSLLIAVADGPMPLGTLPDGRCPIMATSVGTTKDRNIVSAERKPERVVFK
jgi:hypothetical protein